MGVLVATISLAVYNRRLAEGLSVAFRTERDAKLYGARLFEWCRCELSRLNVQKFMVVTADVVLMRRFGFHLATRSQRVAMFRRPAKASFTEAVEACQSDVSGIHRLINLQAREGKLLARTETDILECLNQFFVVRRQGRVVACAALEKYSCKLAEIRSLAVDESYQGNGFGANLVYACLAKARRLRVEQVMAVTGETKFFEKLGFTTATADQKFAVFQEF
jgi:amino-acid N-acetyltransferase